MNAPNKKIAPSVEDALSELTPQLAKLREPFPAHQISQLPKETRNQIDERKNGKNVVWKCTTCGGTHHANAVHLSYVGHAALTDRLLDTDLEWTWEPVGFTPEGLPALDRNGGLWIKLTVCGVTRYGYGAADGKTGGDAMKEMIGDALRNAAMRFGAALELWHKGDLHVETDELVENERGNGRAERLAAHKDDPFPQGPAKNRTELKTLGRAFWRDVEACGDPDELQCLLGDKTNVQLVNQIMKALPQWWDGGHDANGEVFEGLEAVIDRRRKELDAVNA